MSKGMQVVMQTGARTATAGNRPSNCLHASALWKTCILPRIKYSMRGPFPDSRESGSPGWSNPTDGDDFDYFDDYDFDQDFDGSKWRENFVTY